MSNNIHCPHCKSRHWIDHNKKVDDGRKHRQVCKECGKSFLIYAYFQTYCYYNAICDGDHDFSDVPGYPTKKCKKCGEIKKIFKAKRKKK